MEKINEMRQILADFYSNKGEAEKATDNVIGGQDNRQLEKYLEEIYQNKDYYNSSEELLSGMLTKIEKEYDYKKQIIESIAKTDSQEKVQEESWTDTLSLIGYLAIKAYFMF